MEEISVSDTTSSSTSRASKYTISPDIVALGETPIFSTVAKQFLLAYPGPLLAALQRFAEFKYIGLYCGMNNTALYIFMFPFIMILNRSMSLSLAQTCANQANRSIMQSQYTSANVYFAYYFVACFIKDFLVVLLGLLVLKRFYAGPTNYEYFNLTFGLFPFLESATFSLDRFYIVENRLGIVTLKSLISLLCTLVLQPLIMNFCSGGDFTVEQGLNEVAYAELLNYIIQLIWSLIIVFRLKLLGVGYTGVIRFSFKRLRPFRPRFVLHLYCNCISSLLPNINVPLAFLIVQLILKYYPTVESDVNMFFFRGYLIFITASYLQAVHEAFSTSFYRIASYNISIKKLSRTYDFFRTTLFTDLIVIVPFIVVMALTSREMTLMLIPTIISVDRNAEYEVNNCYIAIIITAISEFSACLMKLSGEFFKLEGNTLMPSILHLPSLFYVITAPFCLIFAVGRACDLYYVMAFFELINAMVGIPLIILHNRKYRDLKQAEILRQKRQCEDNDTRQWYSHIRESVVQAFSEAVEAEERADLFSISLKDIPSGSKTADRIEQLKESTGFTQFSRQLGSSGKFLGSVLRRSTQDMENAETRNNGSTVTSSDADQEGSAWPSKQEVHEHSSRLDQ